MAKINEYLTDGEAAELLGVSKDTLCRWDRAGKFEARRHPMTSYRLYLKGELENLLSSLRADGPRSPSRVGSASSRKRKTK